MILITFRCNFNREKEKHQNKFSLKRIDAKLTKELVVLCCKAAIQFFSFVKFHFTWMRTTFRNSQMPHARKFVVPRDIFFFAEV